MSLSKNVVGGYYYHNQAMILSQSDMNNENSFLWKTYAIVLIDHTKYFGLTMKTIIQWKRGNEGKQANL